MVSFPEKSRRLASRLHDTVLQGRCCEARELTGALVTSSLGDWCRKECRNRCGIHRPAPSRSARSRHPKHEELSSPLMVLEAPSGFEYPLADADEIRR
jgi:hypothetical protein